MKTPREIYGTLFEAVQSGQILGDSKTFVDAVPKMAPTDILRCYAEERPAADFDLKDFVHRHFRLPDSKHPAATLAAAETMRAQIETLWDKLTRKPDETVQHSSLIELPKAYVVPGGRFRELYYWDSYFTMLGLADSGRHRLLEDMVDNFAFLIDCIGFIPNGTRSYYRSRSQPPFFVLMVELLATVRHDDDICTRYFPQLQREYEFWMAGADALGETGTSLRRAVRIEDTLLNRYWDDLDEPREESYAEDRELAAKAERLAPGLYRDIRAACESGWDFSSRWFGDGQTIKSICTTRIIPIDLNCILHRVETVLGDVCERSGEMQRAAFYRERAARRKAMIQSRFFDDGEGFFFDLGLDSCKPTGTLSLAAAYPLFFGLASPAQAARVAAKLEKEFLCAGGWVTTLAETGQQWDSPNGWAPLQWVVFDGLRRYGFDDHARTGAARWIQGNIGMYKSSGRFLEKYNVLQPGIAASGGEYSVQDGFGWTNGVLLSLLRRVGGN